MSPTTTTRRRHARRLANPHPVHDTYVAEHGVTGTILYPTCSCGWSGKPTRSLDTAGQRTHAHRVNPTLG